MGDIAFGKSFDMLTNAKEHSALQLLHNGLKPMGYLFGIPWLFDIVSKLFPFLARDFNKFLAYCEGQVEERRKVRMMYSTGVFG